LWVTVTYQAGLQCSHRCGSLICR